MGKPRKKQVALTAAAAVAASLLLYTAYHYRMESPRNAPPQNLEDRARRWVGLDFDAPLTQSECSKLTSVIIVPDADVAAESYVTQAVLRALNVCCRLVPPRTWKPEDPLPSANLRDDLTLALTKCRFVHVIAHGRGADLLCNSLLGLTAPQLSVWCFGGSRLVPRSAAGRHSIGPCLNVYNRDDPFFLARWLDSVDDVRIRHQNNTDVVFRRAVGVRKRTLQYPFRVGVFEGPPQSTEQMNAAVRRASGYSMDPQFCRVQHISGDRNNCLFISVLTAIGAADPKVQARLLRQSVADRMAAAGKPVELVNEIRAGGMAEHNCLVELAAQVHRNIVVWEAGEGGLMYCQTGHLLRGSIHLLNPPGHFNLVHWVPGYEPV